jgi:hypothetical protein
MYELWAALLARDGNITGSSDAPTCMTIMLVCCRFIVSAWLARIFSDMASPIDCATPMM